MKKEIRTENAPEALGPYSQAIIAAGPTIYISGQLPINPKTNEFISNDLREQTKQSLENINAILKAENCSMSDVVNTTILLADIKDFTAMNEVYNTFFSKPFPSRMAFAVKDIPKGALVEISAVAIKNT